MSSATIDLGTWRGARTHPHVMWSEHGISFEAGLQCMGVVWSLRYYLSSELVPGGAPPFTTRLRWWNFTQHEGLVDIVALCLSVNISSVNSKRPQSQLRHAQ